MTSGLPPGQRPPAEERFTAYYAAPKAPWDIGRPQRCFTEAGIRGRVLDLVIGLVGPELTVDECAVAGKQLVDHGVDDIARGDADGCPHAGHQFQSPQGTLA